MTHLFKKIEPLKFYGYDSDGGKTVLFEPLENGALKIGNEVKSIEQWDNYFKENLRHEDLNGRTLVLENICLYEAARAYIMISKTLENGGAEEVLRLFDVQKEE